MYIKNAHDISTKSTSFFDLSKEEKEAVIQESVKNGNFSALEMVTNTFCGIYDYDEHQPYWLESDFQSHLWLIKLEVQGNVREKCIRWDNIILADGEKLTSTKHIPLLNAFKYWITATDNPLENGGKLLKPVTVDQLINKVIKLIDAFLLHGEAIQLSTTHLQALSDDFLMTLFTKIATSFVENGIYDYHEKVKVLLLKEIISISDDDAYALEREYPYVTRNIVSEECVLGLSVLQRLKACCWLKREGFYISCGRATILQGNNTVLAQRLYYNKIIDIDNLRLSRIEELKLDDEVYRTEYPAVPNRDCSNIVGDGVIQTLLKSLKLLIAVNTKKTASHFPYSALQNISLTRIQQHVETKSFGRFKSLPIQLVFNQIKNSYEFSNKYQNSILNSMLSILEKYQKVSQKGISKNIKKRKYGHSVKIKDELMSSVDDKLITLGVNQLYVPLSNDNVFIERRQNQGLVDLYDVLIGSIQLLLGALIARRQGELATLKSTKNLSPNINPDSDEGKNTDYQLIFKVEKSGSGGKHAQNEILKRPIPRSLALLVWNMEIFNQKLIDKKLTKQKNLSLFNSIDSKKLIAYKIGQSSYNTHLNAVCDYFETSLVKYENNELRRYYIRQHQLRRFFAMVFFWSDGVDGLETIRWMLGHTDVEHIYNYITETENGRVLNGVKASYLVDSILNKVKLEKIDTLRKVIARRYALKPAYIELLSLSQVIKDYSGDNYETIPSINYLRKREQVEQQVLELLEDSTISLEPEFFTVKINGEEKQDFHLVLKVIDLD